MNIYQVQHISGEKWLDVTNFHSVFKNKELANDWLVDWGFIADDEQRFYEGTTAGGVKNEQIVRLTPLQVIED